MVQNLSDQKVQNVNDVEKLRKETKQLQESLDELGKKFDQSQTEQQVSERYVTKIAFIKV